MQKKAKLRSALARGAFVAGVRRDMAGGMSLQPCAAAALMACAVAAMVAPQAAWAQPSAQAEFNIPAQPLDSALHVFSEQSKHQVLFEEEAVAGKRAPALNGRLAPREALDRLLVGSGVQVNSARPGVFTLKASPVQPAAGDAATLAEVKVIAQAERAGELPEAYAGGQVARGASLGVLGRTDFLDAPFNITSYTAQLIENQQVRSVSDIVANDSAVRLQNGADAVSEDFRIRGFEVSGTDATLNGLSGLVPGARGLLQAAERVEVLKGPSAVLNGMSPSGGVGGNINIVTKRAPDDPLTRFTASYLSDSRSAGHLDVGRRFGESGEVGVRVNGYFLNGDTALPQQSERIGLLAIGADYRSSNTRLALDVITQEQKIKGPGRYVGFSGNVLEAPSFDHNIFSGEQSNKQSTAVVIGGEHNFGNGFEGFFGIGYQRDSSDYPSIVAAANVDATGIFAARKVYSISASDNISGQLGLRSNFSIGSVVHRATLSVSRYEADRFLAYSFGAPVTSSIYQPVVVPTPDRPTSKPKTSDSVLDGITLADTASFLSDSLLITAGVRHQRVATKNYNATAGGVSSQYEQSANTPLLGIVLKQSPSVSWYANYAEGLSQGGMAPTNATNAGITLPPYKSKQQELGVKIDMRGLGTSLSVFQIEKPSASLDATSNLYAENGKQRNRGIEWSIFGAPTRNIRLLGGVTLMQGKLVESATLGLVGKHAPGVPGLQVNIGAEWDVLWAPGLSLNARLAYSGKQYLDQLNTQQIPSWTRWDIGARYKTTIAGKPTTLRLRIDNLLNNNYWESVYTGYTSLSSPRTVTLSATFDF